MVFDYKQYDGLGLANLIRNKEVTPLEVTEQAIKVIQEKNPKLNAVINTMFDEALQKSQMPDEDKPFYGVPMLLKNILQEIKGYPITAGSKVLDGYKASEDSEFVRQIRKTGVNFLGQTNVPEFALLGTTEPVHYGPTRNPWNTEYTPGGSSGGSAAAVAAGMVPIAGGNDGGGSIRIPSAYCGLFGLKPTRGRTPIGPMRGRQWQGASVDHILTRTVRDSAAMLDFYTFDRDSAFLAPPFEGSYLKMADIPLEKSLKIAYSTQSPIGGFVHEECKIAVQNTVKLLENMGHNVEEKEAPVDGVKLASSYMMLYFGEVAADLKLIQGKLGRKLKRDEVEPTTLLLGILGKTISAEEFVLSLREWDNAARQMERFHDSYDLYVTPTTASPPSRIGELEPKGFEKLLIRTVGSLGWGNLLRRAGIVDQLATKSLERTPFTQLANLTGQPAMRVPLHLTKDGLPSGVQFMARRGREDILIQLAGELEQSSQWINVTENPLF